MIGPFFWLNFGLWLLTLANFVWIWRVKRRETFSGPRLRFPGIAHVLGRGAVLLYGTASLFVLLNASMMLFDVEFSPRARETWRRGARWDEIKLGMTRTEVAAIAGEPFQGSPTDPGTSARWEYGLHPLDLDEGFLLFEPDPAGKTPELVVVQKLPEGAAQAQGVNDWLPYRLRNRFTKEIWNGFAALGAAGFLFLAVGSLLPFEPKQGWNSWLLYTPLLAPLFHLLYEIPQRGGWRFDLPFIFLGYLGVLVGWGVRLNVVLRRAL